MRTTRNLALVAHELLHADSNDASNATHSRTKKADPARGRLHKRTDSPRPELERLEDPRGTHAAANAHGHHAIATLPPTQLRKQRRGQLRPRAPERMPHCDRPTIHI